MAHKSGCEACEEIRRTRPFLINLAKGDTARNTVRLCDQCIAEVKAGHIKRALLRATANDREDARTRELMGHAAYTREGHGAMRQIR